MQNELDVQTEYDAMREREIEYWDFDTKSGEKTDRKIVRLVNVAKFGMREDGGLSIVHENKKELVLLGDANALKELLEWITLIVNIYKTKLVSKSPEPALS